MLLGESLVAGGTFACRAIIVFAFLLLTTPVAAQALVRLGLRLEAGDPGDECSSDHDSALHSRLPSRLSTRR